MNLKETISWLKGRIQEDLFPHLRKCFEDPLTEKQKQLIMILEIVQIERDRHITSHLNQWMGPTIRRQVFNSKGICSEISI